ncbi:hypothetical protein GE061_011704 [Apolygus lucorum]|uniref:Protein-cysteine N-palmitoyltransferase Rasp n=1 Tax=Apolygus lucorum TaxID=248454 RepID=A0A6A4K8L1_APOLU|nr:hypothetical protein GE061_011704 [Apolygus lucorum]
MRASIPRYELFVYSAVWVVSFIYSFYKVFEGGKLLTNLTYYENGDFDEPLLKWLPLKDVSDYDWELWTTLLLRLSPFILLHLVVCERVRYLDPVSIPICHALITVGALITIFPPESTFILIIMLTMFLFALLVRSKLLTWILAVGLLLSVNFFSKYIFHSYSSKYDDITLTILCFEWFLLKCIDFTLIEIRTNRSFLQKFMDLLGYAFYLPCFFLGPFVPYDNFKNGLYRPYEPWTTSRLKAFIGSLLRAFFWYWFFEIASHFFYCHAMHYRVNAVVHLGLWTLNGVGLCLAQFFFIKYIVVYGGALCIARAELYDVPPNPKCVNRIHLYSNMWRHFDRGFYMFISRCIYKPICGSRKSSVWRKLVASFYCFCFVFLWHGIDRTMLIWSTMNFVGICFESLGKSFLKTPSFKRVERTLGSENTRRLEAVVCSPLWVMAVISNYIFFGDYDLGMAYLGQIVSANWGVLLFVFMIGYCMCQISIEVINWETRRHSLHAKS